MVALVAAAGMVSAQAANRVAEEIARLAAEAPAVLPADGSRTAILSRLDRARTAASSGQMYLALYDLQVVFEAEGGYRLASTEKNVSDHAAFTRKWTEMGAPAAPPRASAPVAFVEALAQAAEGRAPATYRASLPYAEDAGLQAGLYYLGESHAMVRFAALCRSLDLRVAARPPALRSIEPELAAYEKDVVKAYDAAPIAQRPQYAGVSVAIKIARTLNEQGRYPGALLQYLVSRYRFALVHAAAPAASAEALKERISRTQLPAGADHSIAEFFLQLGTATLNGPEPALAGAAAILDDILPAYFVVVKQ